MNFVLESPHFICTEFSILQVLPKELRNSISLNVHDYHCEWFLLHNNKPKKSKSRLSPMCWFCIKYKSIGLIAFEENSLPK